MCPLKLAKTSVALIGGILTLSAAAQANPCGSLHQPGKYGPYDYRTAGAEQRSLVERAHFTQEVADLRKPVFQYFGPDLHYTLWAFPNHHRALMTLINLVLKEKSQQPKAMVFTSECYFERALRFTPDDMLARMIYALYLTTFNRKADALMQLDYVAEKTDDAPMTMYNVAKMYFDLEEYEKSRLAMKKAAKQGAPFVDLIEQLRKAGHWDDEK